MASQLQDFLSYELVNCDKSLLQVLIADIVTWIWCMLTHAFTGHYIKQVGGGSLPFLSLSFAFTNEIFSKRLMGFIYEYYKMANRQFICIIYIYIYMVLSSRNHTYFVAAHSIWIISTEGHSNSPIRPVKGWKKMFGAVASVTSKS